jgi:sodium-dependent dicarboxylate transporter 2/3/5
MLSYAAAAGGVATIVGTPPNLIGIGLLTQQDIHITFLKWLTFGLPLAVALLLAAWALLQWLHPSTIRLVPALDATDRLWLTQAAWTRGQINACTAFSVAVCLWLIPGLAAAALGPGHHFAAWLDAHLPNELAALLAAGLLFVLPVDLRHGIFTLSWKQAGHINWGIILLFGGGLAFGELMIKTGLSQAIGEGFMGLFGVDGVWKLTAMAIAAGVLVSEGLSNTASASLLVPVVIGIAQTAAIPPVPPALGACLGSSLGFALPVSTPPNAIVYGTGLVPMANMIRTGLLFDLVGAVLIWLALRIICPLIGLV